MSAEKTNLHHAVRIMPEDVSVRAEDGANLLGAVAAAGVRINARCGGTGSCGKCRVIVKEGAVSEAEDGKSLKITPEEREAGVRLACRCNVTDDVVIEVPVDSRVKKLAMSDKGALAGSGSVALCQWENVMATGEHHPPVRKVFVEMAPPTLQDNSGDLNRLMSALAKQGVPAGTTIDIGALRAMPAVLRQGEWKVTASVLRPANGEGARVLRVEPGDTTDRLFAVSIDIGTTSVHVEITDALKHLRIRKTAEYNGQTAYGEDVISRIVYSLKPGGLEALQKAVSNTANELLSKLFAETGMSRGDISHVVAAGNTTMTQLMAGINAKYVREAPYVPTVNAMPWMMAADCGLDLPADVPMYFVPNVASYVGGDIVSGIMGFGMARREETVLYLDLGTNAEVVVGGKDWLMTASCSAGPAFEGGGLKCGMRAALGAVQGFFIDPDSGEPVVLTVGNEKAVGVCGSGVISMLAELLRHGILQPNGKLNRDHKSVRDGEDGVEFVIVPKEKAAVDYDIVITEPDLDNIIRAKAAVFAGCSTLLEHVGLSYDMLDRIVLTGSFGAYVDIPSAIFIGLMPDQPLEKFCYIDNGSLMGARMCSWSAELAAESEAIARSMTNIELSEDPRFMDAYMAAMFLPHTDLARFPNVTKELESIGGHSK